MKIGKGYESDTKRYKRDVKIILLSVLLLTIITLSFSYSAFFSVQSLSTIQEISTGNLDVAVTIDNTNSILNAEEELFPSTVDEIKNSNGYYSTLTLLNEGNIDADFVVTVSYDFDKLRQVSGYENKTDAQLLEELVSFNYLNIGIYDDVNGNWINFSNGTGENLYPAISGLMASSEDENSYPVLRDKISTNVTGTEDYHKRFKIYIWLSEETPSTEIGKFVYLKLNVKCAAGDETITETVESIG